MGVTCITSLIPSSSVSIVVIVTLFYLLPSAHCLGHKQTTGSFRVQLFPMPLFVHILLGYFHKQLVLMRRVWPWRTTRHDWARCRRPATTNAIIATRAGRRRYRRCGSPPVSNPLPRTRTPITSRSDGNAGVVAISTTLELPDSKIGCDPCTVYRFRSVADGFYVLVLVTQ